MNRLKKFLTDTADSLLRVALRYPAETALCIYACILGTIQIEWSFDYHMLPTAPPPKCGSCPTASSRCCR